MAYIDLIFRGDATSARRAMDQIASSATRTNAAAIKSYAKTTNAIRSTGAAMQSVGRTMTTIGVGMAAVGYYAGKTAVQFNASMEMIKTQAGASQKEVNKLSNSVLNLAASGKVAQGPTDLANSLFHLESIGLRGATAMKALKIAMDGAAVGGSNAEDTASALGAAMVATRTKASGLNALMGTLNATVGAGNMRMGDLVQALQQGVIPAFQNVGLHAKDAFGAIDVLTDAGYQASSAAAQMGTALHYLSDPTTKAQKALALIGMTSTQMASDLKQPQGLLVALRDLRTGLATLPGGTSGVDASQVLGDILPGGRGRVMLTLIQNLTRYQTKLKDIQTTGDQFAGDVRSTQATALFKLHAAWAQIQADLVKLGNAILPVAGQLLPKLLTVVNFLTSAFSRLPGPIKSVFGYLTAGLLVGGPIIAGLGKVLKLIAAIRAAILAVRTAGLVGALTGAATGATTGAAAAASGGGLLAGAARVEAAAGGTAATTAATSASRLAAFSSFLGPFAAVGSLGYMLAASGAGGPLRPGEAPVGNAAGSNAGGRAAGLGGGFSSLHYASGGPIGSDNVPAWLSAGEGIVSKVGMAGLGAGGLNAINNGGINNSLQIQPAPVMVYLDGRLIARSVLQQTLRKAARGPSSLVGGQLTTGATALG